MRQLRDPRRRGMQTHLQCIEVQSAGRDNHYLAVEDTFRRQLLQKLFAQLGKVPVERPQIAALDVDLVASAEHDRTETVPLRLEQKVPVAGSSVVSFASIGSTGGAMRKGRTDGHIPIVARQAPLYRTTNVIVTFTTTATGWPLSIVGLYSHCLTAARAAASSSGTP